MPKSYDEYFPHDEPDIKKLGVELKKSGVCFPMSSKLHLGYLITAEKGIQEGKIHQAKLQIGAHSEKRENKYTEFLETEIEGAERYLTVLHELEKVILDTPTCPKAE